LITTSYKIGVTLTKAAMQTVEKSAAHQPKNHVLQQSKPQLKHMLTHAACML